ncbi:MAG TPA: DUF4097 family beta strand repeat-containing protein [Thermomicrobiales bacterium]|nr:DUF4097 family beta strand repeat-containing protein [Thermomicrobiales bacterium]
MSGEYDEELNDSQHDPGSLDGIAAIRLSCNDIELRIEADPRLRGEVRLTARRGPHGPEMRRENGGLLIHQRGRYRGGQAVLSVPEQDCPPISGSHDRGGLSFVKVNADVSLEHGMGDARFEGGHGATEVASGRGDVTLDGRTGDITVKSGSGDIGVTGGVGAIVLASGRGDIALDDCNGNLIVKSGAGDVAASDCGGSLDIKLGAGDIAVARPKDAWLVTSTGSGDVSIRGGSLIALRAKSGRGDIVSTANLLLAHIEDAELAGSGQGHDEEAGESSADPFGIHELLRSKGLEFMAGDKGVRISGGPFEFEASDEGVRFGKGTFSFIANDQGVRIFSGDDDRPGQFDAQTGKGDVSIDVPANVPARIEAIINSGDVRSDIPLVSVGRPGPRGTTQRLVGVSGSPSATERLNIKLKTNRGDIRVRAINQPAPPTPPRPPRAPVPPDQAPTARIASVAERQPTEEERMRSILDALARGDLSVDAAERALAALERDGST